MNDMQDESMMKIRSNNNGYYHPYEEKETKGKKQGLKLVKNNEL